MTDLWEDEAFGSGNDWDDDEGGLDSDLEDEEEALDPEKLENVESSWDEDDPEL